MNLADMTARGLNGQPITREEALEILRSDDSELRGLLLMADAMALAHAMLLLPTGGHHHGGHSSPVALGAGHASGATA